jgi:hypothetical protein
MSVGTGVNVKENHESGYFLELVNDKLRAHRNVARSPSGKAKVCKTFIGGSIPPRASSNPPQLQRSEICERFCPIG